MNFRRIIPVILLSDSGMIKTVKFKDPVYIGDPINAVRIFNEKEVDEIIILDTDATRQRKEPDFARLEEITSEAFMPLGYGGGIRTIQQMEKLFNIGIEKIILNTEVYKNQKLLQESAKIFGSQSVVVSIDVKRDIFGRYHVLSNGGKVKENVDLLTYISVVQDNGAGEIIINSIDRDGAMSGYDLNLISKISPFIKVPLVALGGAGVLADFDAAIRSGASSVAAGSMFVFHGPHKAVLISYVPPRQLNNSLF
jgi:cyclase